MAEPGSRKLKVFQAQFGFYDTVVAAPSQTAALRAWGTHQNLFATGQATPTDDPQAVEAARAHPETPLRRAVGSADPFALEAASVPAVPDAARKPRQKPPAASKAVVPPRPPADRSRLDAAEAALESLNKQRLGEEVQFRRRQAALDAESHASQAVYVSGRHAAEAAIEEARRAYLEAGGKP